MDDNIAAARAVDREFNYNFGSNAGDGVRGSAVNRSVAAALESSIHLRRFSKNSFALRQTPELATAL